MKAGQKSPENYQDVKGYFKVPKSAARSSERVWKQYLQNSSKFSDWNM